MNTTLTKSVREIRHKRAQEVLKNSPYTAAKHKGPLSAWNFLDKVHGVGMGASNQRLKLKKQLEAEAANYYTVKPGKPSKHKQ